MPRFRKRPVVVEAYQLVPAELGRELGAPRDPYQALWPDWLKAAWRKPREEAGAVEPCGDGIHALTIMTLEGEHRASWGDWIIQGVKGELYAIKNDIFRQTYEPVDV